MLVGTPHSIVSMYVQLSVQICVKKLVWRMWNIVLLTYCLCCAENTSPPPLISAVCIAQTEEGAYFLLYLEYRSPLLMYEPIITLTNVWLSWIMLVTRTTKDFQSVLIFPPVCQRNDFMIDCDKRWSAVEGKGPVFICVLTKTAEKYVDRLMIPSLSYYYVPSWTDC